MSDLQEIIRVFVASPGDITDERNLLETIVNEINLTFSKTLKRRYELVKWETHTRPGRGTYPQSVINKQLPEYDVFLGIMWGRFGTSTPVAESGTEEEFLRACDNYTNNSGVKELLFYFKDQALPPSTIDADQLKKVQTFKIALANEYGLLHHKYLDINEFQTKLRIDLSRILQDWSGSLTVTREIAPSEDIPRAETDDPLAVFNALDSQTEDNDEGVLELMQESTESMSRVVEVVKRIVDAMNYNTGAVRKHTENLKEAAKLPQNARVKVAKRIADSVAIDFELFIDVLIAEIPNFAKYHTLGMETFGKTALISKADFKTDQESVRELLQILKNYGESTTSAYSALKIYRDTTKKLPRMTKMFDRARKRTVALMEDFLNQLRAATNQVTDVEVMLKNMIE